MSTESMTWEEFRLAWVQECRDFLAIYRMMNTTDPYMATEVQRKRRGPLLFDRVVAKTLIVAGWKTGNDK